MIRKICPACNTICPADALECSNAQCGYPLFQVSAVETDDPPLQQPHKPAGTEEPMHPPQSRIQYGRLCNTCNEVRPISMFTCDVCGSDLSSAPIMSNTDLLSAQTAWELCTPDGRTLLIIREGEEKLIGWEHELASYLDTHFIFVSRDHAYLSVHQGIAYIKDNHSKNGVQVGLLTIPPDQPYELQDSNEISLGDTKHTHDERAAHFFIRKTTIRR